MDLISLLLMLRTATHPVPSEVKHWDGIGIASTYHTKNDRKLGGGALACLWGKVPNDLNGEELFCAHRTFKCGTVLFVFNPKTDRGSYCVVLDRGPYGAVQEDGSWAIKIKRSDPGKWRGILDMSPGVAQAIGGVGWDRVKIKRVFLPATDREPMIFTSVPVP